MIAGIGMDMIEIHRVVRACEREAFLKKYFTEAERELIAVDLKRAADNFAVKEAVSKMFGTGFREISPIEIECLRDKLGKPYVNLYGKAVEHKRLLSIDKIYVTITNTRELSAAVAVGETKNEISYESRTDEGD